jgi:hypothetical protein
MRNAPDGQLIELMRYLESEYRNDTDQPTSVLCDADNFFRWSRIFLTKHRPSEVFPVDNNYGITFTNGQSVKLCPDAKVFKPGDMANPDNSIAITKVR